MKGELDISWPISERFEVMTKDGRN